MANALFSVTTDEAGASYANHVDASGTTITASHETSPHVGSNVSTSIIGKRWRTTTLTAHLDCDFGGDVSISHVALRFPRDSTFPSGDIQHKFDPDGGSAGTGATHDSGAVSLGLVTGYGYHLYAIGSTISARYWRFTFSSITGTSAIDVGRAWAANMFQPTLNIRFGFDDQWSDLSRVAASERSGAEYPDARARRRAMSFGMLIDSDNTSDHQDVRELKRLAGLERQVLFIKDPADANVGKEVLIGRLARTSPITQPQFGIFDTTFQIRESL